MLKENLVMLRNIQGYSQEEVAEKVGISRQAYAKWESGATIPDIEKCSRLAKMYGISIDSLIKTEEVEGCGMIPPSPKGKNIWGTVTLGDRGQIIIPKAAREHFHLEGGRRFVLLSEDGEGMALVPAEIFEQKMQALMTGMNGKEEK